MSSEEPFVSIVLPTFNRAASLPRSIHSVLEQTHTNFELLVVDDASTDDSEAVVQRFADARIRYLRQEYNKGAAAARNAGIQHARAGLIAFQDSDDEWLPDKLARQVARLLEAPPKVGLVYCAYCRLSAEGPPSRFPPGHVQPKEGDIHRALLRESFVGTPTILVRRECLDAVGGFDEQLPRFQDWELMIRLSARFEVGFIDEALVRAHDADANISAGHDDALERAERHILEKHRELFRRAGNDVLAHRLWHLAHVLFMRGEMVEGRRRLGQAMDLGFRTRYLPYYALSYSRFAYSRLYAMWDRARARP